MHLRTVSDIIPYDGNFCYLHGSFASHETFHPQKLMPVEPVWKHCGSVAYSHSVDSSNKLSICRHCHPADGAFNSRPRDTLIQAISPNVLSEVSKEVEKSEIALRYRASMGNGEKPLFTSLAVCCWHSAACLYTLGCSHEI